MTVTEGSIPPLGYCARCIVRSVGLVPAVTMIDGTSSCQNCILEVQRTEDAQEQALEEAILEQQ